MPALPRRRFPALADAPLVFSRVCPYALTGDTNFLVARHPEGPRVWLLGGGSGTRLQARPSLAEYVAGLIERGESRTGGSGSGSAGPERASAHPGLPRLSRPGTSPS